MTDTTPLCFRMRPVTVKEHRAIRAVAEGDATSDEQRIALACIMKKLSGAYEQTFVPGDDRSSAFLSGRSFVGQQIDKYIKLPPKEESK